MRHAPTIDGMSPAEFLAWQAHQAESYELVDGRPQMMTGATRRHDFIVTNAIASFRTRLRGGPCRPSTDDIAVIAPNENVRRPDLTIDCGPVEAGSMETDHPVLVLEVLSPSTAHVDKFEKLEEYKGIPSVSYIVIVDASRPHVVLYLRDESRAWSQMSFVGLDSVIGLPALACELPLSELYEDVPLGPAA